MSPEGPADPVLPPAAFGLIVAPAMAVMPSQTAHTNGRSTSSLWNVTSGTSAAVMPYVCRNRACISSVVGSPGDVMIASTLHGNASLKVFASTTTSLYEELPR